jgi:hypothetical protein
MPDGLHSHNFRGVTTFNDGHVHRYGGMTSSDPNVRGHTHSMAGETTYNDGHIHRYSLQTGPEIRVGTGHTHYYRAATTFNDGHVHYLYGYTSVYGRF